MRLISGAYMLEVNKHARWIQLKLNVTDHKCSIGISSIFDTVFRYLPIFLTVLRYWVPPMPPSFKTQNLKKINGGPFYLICVVIKFLPILCL